jgi:NADH-quinone oxidoreductase subunit J
MITNLAFDLFSLILLGSAVMVVSSRNPVHSVLFLILAFINAAALFLIAGAEFLALILVIVYVGAVAVLFMFVVMMLDVNFAELREGVQRYAPVGALVGFMMFVELAVIFGGWVMAPGATSARMSITPADLTNTQALGSLIYTKYLFLFQLSGAILLVSMIGAIVLTLRDRNRGKHQNLDVQHERRPADTLVLVSTKLGEGALVPRKPEDVI